MPANEFARQFDAAFGSARLQLDLVLFLEGQERARQATERPVEAFRPSWRWPKWHLGGEDAVPLEAPSGPGPPNWGAMIPLPQPIQAYGLHKTIQWKPSATGSANLRRDNLGFMP